MLSMRAAGVDTEQDLLEIFDVGSHEQVIKSIYSGEVDAGTCVADARVLVEEELSDVMKKVIVLTVTPAIPNDGVQFSTSVDAETRDRSSTPFWNWRKPMKGKQQSVLLTVGPL